MGKSDGKKLQAVIRRGRKQLFFRCGGFVRNGLRRQDETGRDTFGAGTRYRRGAKGTCRSNVGVDRRCSPRGESGAYSVGKRCNQQERFSVIDAYRRDTYREKNR